MACFISEDQGAVHSNSRVAVWKSNGITYRSCPFRFEVDDLKSGWRSRSSVFLPLLLGLDLNES